MTQPTSAPAPGNLFVIAGPSGGGKTSLVRALLEREPDIHLSISYTTRAPRIGEVDGVDYHFVTEPRFSAMNDAGEFLEHARVHGNWYATSARWLADQVARGHDVLLEIDWQGARQVQALIPSTVRIFVLPPSLALLRARLEKRGQNPQAEIERRLEAARDEIRHCGEFDYVIINQEFAATLEDLMAIVRASRLRAGPQQARHAQEIASLLESTVHNNR